MFEVILQADCVLGQKVCFFFFAPPHLTVTHGSQCTSFEFFYFCITDYIGGILLDCSQKGIFFMLPF